MGRLHGPTLCSAGCRGASRGDGRGAGGLAELSRGGLGPGRNPPALGRWVHLLPCGQSCFLRLWGPGGLGPRGRLVRAVAPLCPRVCVPGPPTWCFGAFPSGGRCAPRLVAPGRLSLRPPVAALPHPARLLQAVSLGLVSPTPRESHRRPFLSHHFRRRVLQRDLSPAHVHKAGAPLPWPRPPLSGGRYFWSKARCCVA